jgi:radical SAM protein with 4Fe4S-binding SPASM domain
VFQGGEVLLRKDWHEIVSYARDKGFLTALTTNGVLVDTFIDKVDVFDSFVFSIDSLKIHDDIRGKKGTFKRAVSNMRTIVNMGYPVYIDAVLQKDNYREIPDFVRFAKAENVMLNLVYPLVNAFDDTVPQDDELRQFDFDELRALLSDALKYDWVLNVMEFYELCIQTTFQETKRQCLAPRMKIIIQPDGRIFPCCGPLPSIGDISSTPFNEIYNSKLYTDVRKNAYDGTLKRCWRCVSDSIQPSFYTFRNLMKRYAGT